MDSHEINALKASNAALKSIPRRWLFLFDVGFVSPNHDHRQKSVTLSDRTRDICSK